MMSIILIYIVQLDIQIDDYAYFTDLLDIINFLVAYTDMVSAGPGGYLARK